MNHRFQKTALALAILLLGTAFGVLSPQVAEGDDRDLFRSSSNAPYIFILFDVTGSMWQTTGNANPPLFDDDEDSKMWLAKEALYQVMSDVRGVNFGFATFPNQDETRVTGLVDVAGEGTYVLPTDLWNETFDRDVYCEGWEGNDDSEDSPDDDDTYDQPNTGNEFNLKYANETLSNGLELGDILPLNWDDNNIERLQERLAPNLLLGETDPDFGIARYFEDTITGSRNFHRLVDNDAKPFIANGSTPLETALRDFEAWYVDWEDDARAADPEFDCREVFVLLMTDGFDTCSGDAPPAAADLLDDHGIETYVVGFAIDNDTLDDIAFAGGTETAFDADTGDELVEVFNTIINDVLGQARTFSSAVVPSLQSAAGRSVFLSSFNAINGAAIWPGRLDSYAVPVPFVTTPDGTVVADRSASKKCSNRDDPDEESCWAWFAGAEILDQAPDALDPTSTTPGDWQFGTGTNERRVFFGAERTTDDIPADRKCFLPVGVSANLSSLCDPQAGDDTDLYGPTGLNLADFDDAEDVLAEVFEEQQGVILDTNGDEVEIDYVLGDIFHSQPTVTEAPDDTLLFARSLEGRLEICGDRVDGGDDLYGEAYACFADTHAWRRRMVVAGSNDGQLHFFDAGRPVDDIKTDPFGEPVVTFTAGTGAELFAYVPRDLMPTVASMATGGPQDYGVDAPVTLGDVGIDPEHNGTPDPDDREWRSVVISGLREGGRSYSALDITQPDPIDTDNRPSPFVSESPGCLVDGVAGCDFPFPSVLWEFTDTWDEDDNGAADLGFTWSKARIGRIRLDDGSAPPGNEFERWVAVFGGGMDPDYKREPINDNGTPDDTSDDFDNPWSGNYLYMVDIETGETIYKRRLDHVNPNNGNLIAPAMVPSEVAAVDTDFDSFLDTMYVGTTAGVMYKVDIRTAAELETFDVTDHLTGTTHSVTRVDRNSWEPFRVFRTGSRPIYYPPSVVFFSELNQYAIAFGVGDREDLWEDTDQNGRFYFLLDEDWTDTTAGLPFNQGDYKRFGRNSAANEADDFIFSPGAGLQPGWIITLAPEERITARSLVISGVVFFNSFVPNPFVPADGLCAQTGFSRIFAVLATNGDGLLIDPLNPGDDPDRYQSVSDFATSPYVQSSETEDDVPDDQTEPPTEELSDQMQALRDKLKDLQPDECRFANYTLNVLVDTTESGSQLVAPVPICIIERNFKQF